MWQDAIEQSLKFIRKKELTELKKAEKIFTNLEKEDRNFEDAIKAISEV